LRPKVKTNDYQWYHLRIWHGMTLGDWWRLIRRNGFSFSPSRLGLVLTSTLLATFNSSLALFQNFRFKSRIKNTRVHPAPIFILGHWRSGTTWLHELLTQDPQFNFPTHYACFAPRHFVLTQKILSALIKPFVPKMRPMDPMAMGPQVPQEDEFALLNLAPSSPYEHMAFPQNHAPGRTHLDPSEWTESEGRLWGNALLDIFRALSFCDFRPLVLKSPTHTARVSALLKLFPKARFIHITRNPMEIFQSTLKLWRALISLQGLQTWDFVGLEQRVVETFRVMYRCYFRDRGLIPKGQLVEIRYEDLVQDPLGTLDRIYGQLDLQGFDLAIPNFREYLEEKSGYQVNRQQGGEPWEDILWEAWGNYADHFGYARPAGGGELRSLSS